MKLNVLAEIENVSSVGQYDSTSNGKTQYPVIADPEGTNVNQIYLGYHNGAITGTFGRQRINQDGQRFIGGVGWRQNEQTYDGYRLEYALNKATKLDYTFVHNVNRIFGPTTSKADEKGAFHFGHASFKINDNHKITAFVYD